MRSLRTQLILQIFLPLTLVSTLVVWQTFSTVESLMEHRLEKEIELVARALRLPVEQALLERDLRRLEQSLSAAFEIDRVYGAFVYDANGQRVAVAGEVVPGRQQQRQAVEVVALGEELGAYADMGGEEVFSYFVPLTGPGGRIEGLLQVVRQESEIALRLRDIRNRAWWMWGGVMLLVFSVLLLGHRLAVVRHVEKLLADMHKVESGEHAHRARIRGPLELARLAEALNRMLDGIQRMESELADKRREHLEMTERMREQEKLAALGRFSSGVAHELGAPLTVIDGDARRLERDNTGDQEARRRLGRMRRQVDRTRQLIRQLMDFVRDDDSQPERIDVPLLLKRVATGVAPQADQLGIRVSFAELPDGIALRGFPVRLEHALLNLTRNAVQAARRQVAVSVLREGDRVVLAVEDDGSGVPEAISDRIFEPFQTSREQGEGTGLGLAIVRSVAEEHGAAIEVDRSERLGGSRFRLILKAD